MQCLLAADADYGDGAATDGGSSPFGNQTSIKLSWRTEDEWVMGVRVRRRPDSWPRVRFVDLERAGGIFYGELPMDTVG